MPPAFRRAAAYVANMFSADIDAITRHMPLLCLRLLMLYYYYSAIFIMLRCCCYAAGADTIFAALIMPLMPLPLISFHAITPAYADIML